ncbi:MAG: hypothetical protein ABW133_01545, partial [Polyangiaceae bacterium]
MESPPLHPLRDLERVGRNPIATFAASLALCAACSDARPPSPPTEEDAGAVDATTAEDATRVDVPTDRTPRLDAPNPGAEDAATRCPARVDIVEGCVLAGDGTLVKTPLVRAMTVTAIEEIPSGACRIARFDQQEPPTTPGVDLARRLTLQGADGTEVSVVIRAPGLPADLVQVGKGIDLSLQAWADDAAF